MEPYPLFSTLFEARFRDTSGDRTGQSRPSLSDRARSESPVSQSAGTSPSTALATPGSESRTTVQRWIGRIRVGATGASHGTDELDLGRQPYRRRVLLLEDFWSLYIARRREELVARAESEVVPDRVARA